MNQKYADLAARRAALRALALASLAPLSGCAFLRPRDLSPVCPNAPSVSYPGGPLTIDAHCHVFNGTDLQVKQFLSRVAVQEDGPVGLAVQAIGDILERLAWQNAPSGAEELNALEKLAAALQTCTTKGYAEQVNSLKQDGYTRGRAQLQAAMKASPQFQTLKSRGSNALLSVHPDSHDAARVEAIAIIDSLPESFAEYDALTAEKARREATHSGLMSTLATRSVSGVIKFVQQNFQYRYVSVHDYLATYNKPGERVVDLMLPSMVDYDFWLNEGHPTHTDLETQVRVMRQISILTGGRVHAFAPYDPLRQVAHLLGHASANSLAQVQRAIEEDGFVGVKLYPPMGFAPLGNERLDGRNYWKRSWLPDWTARPDLGKLLDGAMRDLLSWCESNGVPIMAHTSASNAPTKEFEEFTAATYWAQALHEFPDLRVSFGHFGGSSPVKDDGKRALEFSALMNQTPGAAGSLAYADAGYFLEVISKEPQLEALLRQLYETTAGKGDASLVSRFMYGTDWEMTLMESPVNTFLGQFEALLNDLETQPAIKARGHTDLASRFFGFNASRWAGLEKGSKSRERLDRFYQLNGIKPDWVAKVDGRTA